MGRKPVLPVELEEELVKYCLEMEKNYYGITASDLKRMAFQLAIRNNIPHPFSQTKMKAGKKWMKLFMARHPALSFRKPESLSRTRVQGFTAENVKTFFDLLKPEMQKINFNPNKIFNVDETGISTVQHKVRKILTIKGKRDVHKLSSAERGALVTVVTCMSAAGQFIPPLMVFPRKNMKAELLDGTPPGTIGGCHPSGWIQPELFTKWLKHFVSIAKPSKEDPVLLVLDGHYSHTRNLDVIDITRESGVSIICLPPHSTDRMQPLDVSLMFPLKTYYAQEIENWLINHPGQVVTHYQVGGIFGKAYGKACKIDTAVNGFRKTGIFPLNENIFDDSPHAPSSNDTTSSATVVSSSSTSTSAIPQTPTLLSPFTPTSARSQTPTPLSPLASSSRPKTPTSLPSTSTISEPKTPTPSPSTSSARPPTAALLSRPGSSSSSFIVPADLQPVPVIEPPSASTRRGKAMVVTASPHKRHIIEAEKKRKDKNEKVMTGKKRARSVKKTKTAGNKNKTMKRKKKTIF